MKLSFLQGTSRLVCLALQTPESISNVSGFCFSLEKMLWLKKKENLNMKQSFGVLLLWVYFSGAVSQELSLLHAMISSACSDFLFYVIPD